VGCDVDRSPPCIAPLLPVVGRTTVSLFKQYGTIQGVYKLCISRLCCTVLYLYFDVLHPCIITGQDT